jgi:ATP-dependent DNA helicase RecQ
MVTTGSQAVDVVARERLGIASLRPEQRRALRAAIAGRDTLVVMPTGSGKSAVYQLAGELRRGPTLVVSPLLAL